MYWSIGIHAIRGGGGYRRVGKTVIKFRTLNIWNRRNGGLESSLSGMDQANLDLGVFQETKVANGLHTHELDGHCVLIVNAPSRQHGEISVF